MLASGFQKAAYMYQARDVLKGDTHLHAAVIELLPITVQPAQKLSVSDQQDRNAAQLAVCHLTTLISQI